MSLKYLMYWNLFYSVLDQKMAVVTCYLYFQVKRRALQQCSKQFMRVPCQRIRSFNPQKSVFSKRFTHQKSTSPCSLYDVKMINKNGTILISIGFYVCLWCLNQRTYASKLCLLTSTWSHKSCLLQIFAISSIGSNAPFTVVPAVALTKNGVLPSALCLKIRSSSLSGRILPLKKFVKYTWS